MIQSISIRNYLSHKDSELHFHRGLNAITGTSNHGKSVIIRALRWWAENKPGGNAFVSWWGGPTRVEVVTWQGDSIIRKKGKANLYYVNGKKLEAFGADVPQEVRQLLRLSPLNWQHQHDSPFLLSESAGEVGRRLNEIVDLDIVDRALSIVQSDVRDTKRDIETEKIRYAEFKQQVEQLAPIEKLAPLIDSMEKLERQIERRTKQLEQLRKTAATAFELQKAIQANQAEENSVAGRIERIAALLKAIKPTETKSDALNDLVDVIRGQQDTEHRLAACVVFGEKELKKAIGNRCPLCKQEIRHEH